MRTSVFDFRYQPDNLFDVEPGVYRGVAIGYFLMLRPLPAGNHTVVVRDGADGEIAQMTGFFKVVCGR